MKLISVFKSEYGKGLENSYYDFMHNDIWLALIYINTYRMVVHNEMPTAQSSFESYIKEVAEQKEVNLDETT